MSFWKVDLTTEDGAENAAAMGGMACFIVAGLTTLGAAFAASTAAGPEERIGMVLVFSIMVIMLLVAGWRLRGGKGAYWGAAAAVLLLIEIVSKLITLTGIPGLVINAVLLIVVVNGVRGAWALRRGIQQNVGEVFR